MCQWLLDRWQPGPSTPFWHWLRGPQQISWPAAVAGAFIGTYSHVFLDSIMHADLRPLAPLSDANGFLYLVSIDALHLGCVAAGLLGVLALIPRFASSSKRMRP